MAIINALYNDSNYPVYDKDFNRTDLSRDAYVAKLRAEGATVELFDAPRKLYNCSSSLEAIGTISTYVGCVLATGEKNYHDDSDFYAIVWDEETQSIRTREYDTTRYAGGGNATIDATDEVKAKANAYLEKWAYDMLVASDRAEAAKVTKGKRVRVVKGRKVPIGTEGLVFWLREDYYGGPSYSSWARSAHMSTKIGIATSDRKNERGGHADVAWTYAKNCEVVNPEQFYTADEVLRARAKRIHGSWRAIEGYWSAKAGMLVA